MNYTGKVLVTAPAVYTLNIEYTRLYSIFRQLSRERAYYILKAGGEKMISYAPFYDTLKRRGLSTYKLIKDFGVSRSLLDRLRHDKPISTQTVDDLCSFLNCKVEDILVYKK